ncbi:Resolvase, N terminal domain [Clostridium grantii DSM 8605]|uniref:Resolvase, N terminal domain n=2 Tax=Clostridium TaxID=1485 RepID=A0A1M5WS89_9CLOT|nr:Resolvase, N terminal domain [Clostridium grantii DSM 8605]
MGKKQEDVQNNVFIYCRVSTKKQKQSGNLERQKQRLLNYCSENQYTVVDVFDEVASGLNDKRRELTMILRRLNEVNCIIVEYPDRLARFGYNYLKEFAKSLEVDIKAVEHNKELELNEEMVSDLVSVVTYFSAR